MTPFVFLLLRGSFGCGCSFRILLFFSLGQLLLQFFDDGVQLFGALHEVFLLLDQLVHGLLHGGLFLFLLDLVDGPRELVLALLQRVELIADGGHLAVFEVDALTQHQCLQCHLCFLLVSAQPCSRAFWDVFQASRERARRSSRCAVRAWMLVAS